MTTSEQNHAYLSGLTEMREIDSEVAEDLGIPQSIESFEQQVESGRRVKELLAYKAVDGAIEHASVVEIEGCVTCANCNTPGCRGCGRS